jgi:hypothetical protein
VCGTVTTAIGFALASSTITKPRNEKARCQAGFRRFQGTWGIQSMTSINQTALPTNALRGRSRPTMRAFSWDRDGSERRAAIYVARLAALRIEIFVVRCQLDNPRNECRRELLATRLDATDARTADVFARMCESRAS